MVLKIFCLNICNYVVYMHNTRLCMCVQTQNILRKLLESYPLFIVYYHTDQYVIHKF